MKFISETQSFINIFLRLLIEKSQTDEVVKNLYGIAIFSPN